MLFGYISLSEMPLPCKADNVSHISMMSITISRGDADESTICLTTGSARGIVYQKLF